MESLGGCKNWFCDSSNGASTFEGRRAESDLDKMGITERDLLVVGDANDISMFELANWSVAVERLRKSKNWLILNPHICTEIHSSLSLMLSLVDF